MTVAAATDVAIIGAGPAGSVAAALLRRHGHQVTILERAHFPRFSIGESLLPHCMDFLDEAGLLPAVTAGAAAAGFQLKNGAMFQADGASLSFDFSDKLTPGWSSTYEVKRAAFDQILAHAAADAGAELHFGHTTTRYRDTGRGVALGYADPDGREGEIEARFCLDASGFGRVLPRLLGLERPSDFLVRQAVFTHVLDRMAPDEYDRNKILISVHPAHPDVWFWLIPFSDGTASLGVVGEQGRFDRIEGPPAAKLAFFVQGAPALAGLLRHADYPRPVGTLKGYAARVSTMYGERFALLGNAAEFLDPIFSSGVTIALKSASLATAALTRQLRGEPVDWQADFATPLARGVEVFRHFVARWYDGSLQDIILTVSAGNPKIRRMVCSVLAGYVWDDANPLVTRTRQRLGALAEICRAS